GPAAVTNVVATAKPGALDLKWDASARANRYYVTVKNAAGVNAPGSPLFADGTGASLEGLTAGTEYSVSVRAQNVASRSANSTIVKAAPTQGARVATTTTVAFEGPKVVGETQKLIATVSEPGATGTVQFFADGSRLQDTFAKQPLPNNGGNSARTMFPVVDGKAVIDITDQLSPGLVNLQAKFTTSNAENFTSSDSAMTPVTVEGRPKLPWMEITAISGDRVAGSRIGIAVKLHGYTPTQLWRESIPVEFDDRTPGATYRTRLTGDTVDSQYGYATLNADGEATFYTTALAAGDHRISVYLPNFSLGYAGGFTSEIPLKIAAAGTPPATAPALKRPSVALVASGPGKTITNQPVTLTAHVSDPSLAGTVEFTNSSGDPIKTGVAVVNGIATYTGVLPYGYAQVYARFEPAADRDTTLSPVSFGVTLVRATTEQPSSPATATTTTLDVAGDRVVGTPLTANVTVAPDSADPFADRDVNGYVEVLDGATVVGFSPTYRGKSTIDLSGLGAGSHTLSARYVPSDDLRSVGSASAAQNVAVVVKSDTPGTVGGSVGATLSLALGAPASFGAFLPGVEKDYTASTTATVLSTAGDAALTVSDPGHLANGSFSLPSPLEVSFSKSTWSAPTSNEAVTIGFKQHIGATDAIRTGTYSETLTFTLSTTTP
ncbi:MAG TPA: fibronectin type III domain-containing protein, partial [Solirubrobacter sp.]